MNRNLDALKGELRWTLLDYDGQPDYLIIEVINRTLDKAEREAQINQKEREEVQKWIKGVYDFEFDF